jgi:hypothetical protein
MRFEIAMINFLPVLASSSEHTTKWGERRKTLQTGGKTVITYPTRDGF